MFTKCSNFLLNLKIPPIFCCKNVAYVFYFFSLFITIVCQLLLHYQNRSDNFLYFTELKECTTLSSSNEGYENKIVLT